MVTFPPSTSLALSSAPCCIASISIDKCKVNQPQRDVVLLPMHRGVPVRKDNGKSAQHTTMWSHSSLHRRYLVHHAVASISTDKCKVTKPQRGVVLLPVHRGVPV